MKQRKSDSPLRGDIERTHPTVADSVGDGLGRDPLTVKLSNSWSDLSRVPDEAQDSEGTKQRRHQGGVPLLDDMKGILQWD
ncbi:MAG TPA: hypothetical protein VGG76_12785 [Gemmatimonadaceae bacterium]|jgi:hypothetical protein